jgi:hypothetical protein
VQEKDTDRSIFFLVLLAAMWFAFGYACAQPQFKANLGDLIEKARSEAFSQNVI